MKTFTEKTLQLLGLRARDKVSGFEGVISSVHFDLYGCVQVVLAPEKDKDGKMLDSHYFDIQRLDVSTVRVMPVPNFNKASEPAQYDHGPAEKPSISSKV